MTEVWKSVVGGEGLYWVSNLGRVRSHVRWANGACGCKRRICGKIMAQHDNGQGYPSLTLCLAAGKTVRTTHSLVAEAFLGPRKDGFQVDHIDGNRANPSLVNLEYVTRQENILRGKKTKLTDDECDGIRDAVRRGETHRSVARRFGCSHTNVGHIARGQSRKTKMGANQ